MRVVAVVLEPLAHLDDIPMAGVVSTDGGPLRSRRALVATVVPCTISSVRARGNRVQAELAASSPRPSSAPIEGSEGGEADFASVVRLR